MKTTGKRLRVVWITDMLVEELLKGQLNNISINNEIPKDATVHCIYYNPERACFGVVIEHKSFDKLEEAEMIPTLKVELTKGRDNMTNKKQSIRFWVEAVRLDDIGYGVVQTFWFSAKYSGKLYRLVYQLTEEALDNIDGAIEMVVNRADEQFQELGENDEDM